MAKSALKRKSGTAKKPVSRKAKKVQSKGKDPSTRIAEAVIKGIQEKKGKGIVWLDLRKIESAVCSYFIICEAPSSTQIAALAGSVEEVVKNECDQRPWHSEGRQNAQWLLIDYVTVVVHIFQTEIRSFYNLEGLWADAEKMKIK